LKLELNPLRCFDSSVGTALTLKAGNYEFYSKVAKVSWTKLFTYCKVQPS